MDSRGFLWDSHLGIFAPLIIFCNVHNVRLRVSKLVTTRHIPLYTVTKRLTGPGSVQQQQPRWRWEMGIRIPWSLVVMDWYRKA